MSFKIIANASPEFCQAYVKIEGDSQEFFLHCLVSPKRWNGWLAPLLDRPAVESLISEIMEQDSTNPYYSFKWDGDVVTISKTDEPEEFEDCHPDSNGLYNCQWGWVWESADLLKYDDLDMAAGHKATADYLALCPDLMNDPELATNDFQLHDYDFLPDGTLLSAIVRPNPPQVGERYGLIHNIERFPYFIVAAHEQGVIVQSDDEIIRLKMDNPIEGCEEWNNCIEWYFRDYKDGESYPNEDARMFYNYAASVPPVQSEPTTEKQFPNGFTSWIETHHEVVAEITRIDLMDVREGLVFETRESQGTGGLYELAKSLTNEFENLHASREWDGEFFDEIESFLNSKNL